MTTRTNTHSLSIPQPVNVATVSEQDNSTLFQTLILDASFFDSVRSLVRRNMFSPNEIFSCLWSAMDIAFDQYRCWDEATLRQLTEREIAGTELHISEDTKNAMLKAEPGGFLYETFRNQPSESGLSVSREILGRLLNRKLIVDPLRNAIRPDCHPGDIHNIGEIANYCVEQARRIESINLPSIPSVNESWDDHELELDRFRGREMIGISTGIQTLDRKTMGLRGAGLLGAGPGVGKTALCLQIAKGVCEQPENSDVIVVFVSFELTTSTLTTRLKSNLTGISFRDYILGQRVEGGREFTDYLVDQANDARRRAETTIGSNLFFLDSKFLADKSIESVAACVNRLKDERGATRALVIVDYLQLLDVPERVFKRGDLECDKYRIRQVQSLNSNSISRENPLGDAILAISEVRKPSGDSRNRTWADGGLADYSGSSRLGYAAEVAFTLRRMKTADVRRHYGVPSNEHATGLIQRKEEEGIAPLILSINKGRDGMTTGEISLEFDFYRTQIFEIQHGRRLDSGLASGRRQRPPRPRRNLEAQR